MGSRRLRFGVLLSTLDRPIQGILWKSLVEFANENNIDLIAYFSTYESITVDKSLHFETCFKSIYNSNLDGLLVFSGFIVLHLGHADLNRYISEVPKHIPIVSMLYMLDGIHSVVVENTLGMYTATNHLIKQHNKRKIAFVSGPKRHREAMERLDGYKNALFENDIVFNKRLVLPGGFCLESGRNAVKEMLDERKLIVDAIAVCDDVAAMGVIDELKKRNINVPEDIAVVGFGNDRDASLHVPAISTARQDFYDVGKTSIEVLLRLVNGKQANPVTHVLPDFIVRQSCGCGGSSFSHFSSRNDKKLLEADSFTTFAIRNIIPDFQINVPSEIIEKWVISLVNNLQMVPFVPDDFIRLINNYLTEYSYYSNNYFIWNDILEYLELGAVRFCDFEFIQEILHTLIAALRLVQEIRFKVTQTQILKDNDFRLLVRRISSDLISSLDINVLANEIYNTFSELSINTALVGLYENYIRNNDSDTPRKIGTLIGYSGDKKIRIKSRKQKTITFSDLTSIAGVNLEEERILFFLPLFISEYEIGALLISYNANIPNDIYETLRISITSAIKSADLLSTYRVLSTTDELTGVYNRRGFYQFAESRLSYMSREKDAIPIVIFMDMDGLKSINDIYGHNEGDMAIKVISQNIKKVLRKCDVIGRIGGDEFAVLSSVKVKEDYKNVEMRIRNEFERYNSKKRHPYEVDASFGSVILETPTIECLEEAMLNADRVLYDEKFEKKQKMV